MGFLLKNDQIQFFLPRMKFDFFSNKIIEEILRELPGKEMLK